MVAHTPGLCRQVRGGGPPLQGRRPPARVAALREQITARTADSPEHTSTAGLDDGQARREQLTRWHHDDTDTVHDTTNADHGDDQDGDQGDDGWGWSR